MGMTKLSKEDGDKIEIKRYDRQVEREPKKCILLQLKDLYTWENNPCDELIFEHYVLEDNELNRQLINELRESIKHYYEIEYDTDNEEWLNIEKMGIGIYCYAIEPILDKMKKFEADYVEVEW